MRKRKLFEKIINDNYAAVFRFCNARLWGDYHGAEECTQEVFLLFLQKIDDLDLNDHIDRWLIAVASRIVKKYLRQKAERAVVAIEEIEELPDETLSSFQSEERSSKFDVLTDEEYDLLLRYYNMDNEQRNELAADLGISINTLYQRIYAIKRKFKT